MFKKILGLVILGVFLGSLFFYSQDSFLNKKSDQTIEEKKSELTILKKAQDLRQAVALMPDLLGYETPKIYLVLFLNNTEIRPGGGFIGSYALVRLDKRQITLFETNGSENLDWSAPASFNIEPPLPIKIYLKQPRWFFRDSNWSPDFPSSAKKAAEFYRLEGGKEGDKIVGVIGITPTVIETLMKYVGPITVSNKTFTIENFTDALEYHVEYGYKESGQEMSDRKIILGDLGREFIKKITALSASQWINLWSDFLKLTSERQIMVFSNDQNVQDLLVKSNWAGEIKKTNGDYLLISDSNLASLKTDPSVKKSISYKLYSEGKTEKYRARLEVIYNHQGNFDWKTTRYRTYTRIYVPLGAELIKSEGFIDSEKKSVSAEISQEFGKTVFGGFLSVEPQSQKTLVLEYYLPKEIFSLANHPYTLFVQKALGSLSIPLTIDLDFGKKEGAGPTQVFHKKIDLVTDREFKVNF